MRVRGDVRTERDALQGTLGLGGSGEGGEKRVESTLEFGGFGPGKGETEDLVDSVRCQTL